MTKKEFIQKIWMWYVVSRAKSPARAARLSTTRTSDAIAALSFATDAEIPSVKQEELGIGVAGYCPARCVLWIETKLLGKLVRRLGGGHNSTTLTEETEKEDKANLTSLYPELNERTTLYTADIFAALQDGVRLQDLRPDDKLIAQGLALGLNKDTNVTCSRVFLSGTAKVFWFGLQPTSILPVLALDADEIRKNVKDRSFRPHLRVRMLMGELKPSEMLRRWSLPDGIGYMFDSTYVLAADGELGVIPQDPLCVDALEMVTTVFCGCRDVYFVRPPKRPKTLTPILSVLWEKGSPKKGSTSLRDSERSELARTFIELVNKEPELIARWTGFQCRNPRLDRIFWGGGTYDKLREAQELLRAQQLHKTAEPFLGALRNEKPVLVGRGARSAKQFGGMIDYLSVYAFLAFLKGRTYWYDQPPGSTYHCHPLRIHALPDKEQEKVLQEPPFPLFPWGKVFVLLRKEGTLRVRGKQAEQEFSEGLPLLADYSLNYFSPDVWASPKRLKSFLQEGFFVAQWLDRNTEAIDRLLRAKKLAAWQHKAVEAIRVQVGNSEEIQIHRRTKQSFASIAAELHQRFLTRGFHGRSGPSA